MAIDPTSLPVSNVLVIAPHQDDESLGCGGLIARLGKASRNFHTIFVTDGGASHLGSREWPRSRVAAQRELEAAEALACLGIGNCPKTFLRLPDANMPVASSPAWNSALAHVLGILQLFCPQLVLLPWRRDPHRDHRDSWRLATDAIANSATQTATLEYAIWLEEFGQPDDFPRADEAERIDFDIAAAVPAKRAAVGAHRSQTTNLIADDPEAFRLTTATIERLTGPIESYWRSFP
jgi:LmbE family N-acetylglucosaminyl deacetylase